MTFVLSQDNLVQYLVESHLVELETQTPVKIDCFSSKNFNLVATFSDQSSFLVKQKRFNEQAEIKQDFYDEWRVCHLMQTVPKLSSLLQSMSEVLHYDPHNAIIVLAFFPDYQDLKVYYEDSNQYSPTIGTAIGQSLGTLHRLTANNEDYCNFLIQDSSRVRDRKPNFLQRFDRLEPDIFGLYCLDGLEFFRRVQRSQELTHAIAALKDDWQSTCLIHQDLKLDNVILRQDCSQQDQSTLSSPLIKIIDWELFTWGDPLFDLGTLIGSYLMQWLGSLVIKPGLSMSQSLRLAKTPLELIQPILITLIRSYFQAFPQLLQTRPNALQITLKYAGFHIFRRLVHQLSRHYPFDQGSICSLQIVKRLLCEPEFSFDQIFGLSQQEFEVSLYGLRV